MEKSKCSRKFLTLKEKIEVINLNKAGMSARSLSMRFNVGKTQIQNIIKNKTKYEHAFKKNDVSVDNKKMTYKTGNEKVNELLWKWFCHARSQNYVISGPVLKAQALEFAKQEGNSTFKASNGWLESFLKRHKIVFGTTSGERAQIDSTVVENWFDQLKSICEGYHPKDIFNFDESGLVFKSGQVKTYKVKGDEAPGIKMPKDRVTLAFLCNMLGDKESLIFIWKHKKPRCFKNAKIENMDVKYFFNKRAWMTSTIFQTCMESFDFKMKKENRKVLMFLDNASSHPDIMLENVKFAYLPPNTTAKLQPLDQGIIESFKKQFRKLQMSYCLDLLNNKQIPFQDALKQITVLDAIVWSMQAWQNVNTTTIQKCFKRCGFQFAKEPLELEECPEDQSDDDSNNSIVEYEVHNYDKLAHELFGCDYNSLCSVTEQYAIHELFSNSVTEFENEQTDGSENVPSSDEDTSQETVKKNISFNEAKESFNTLLNYSVQVGDDALFKHLTCVQKRLDELSRNVAVKQSVITSYFQKQ
jgi:hypothetical protein